VSLVQNSQKAKVRELEKELVKVQGYLTDSELELHSLKELVQELQLQSHLETEKEKVQLEWDLKGQ
jgi:hypothetical protein